MLSEYVKDLFTEGFGDIFFMKYYRFLMKSTINKGLKTVLLTIYIIFYLIFLIIIGIGIFILKYPL